MQQPETQVIGPTQTRRTMMEGIVRDVLDNAADAYTFRSKMEQPFAADDQCIGWAGPLGSVVFLRRAFLSPADGLWHFGLYDVEGAEDAAPFLTSKRAAQTEHELMADQTPILPDED